MPNNFRRTSRVTKRAAAGLAAVASILLLATCDLDKITGTKTDDPTALDSTFFSITGGTEVILGGTTTLGVAPAASTGSLAHTVQRWSSSNPLIVAIDSVTGVASGIAIGTANITTRLLAPELGTGVTNTAAITVRYKGIRIVNPTATDSITGLAQTRNVVTLGLTNNNTTVPGALAATITSKDTTIFRVNGSVIVARKSGAAHVVAVFDNLRDSVLFKVRQVAKNITFPTTDYFANAVSATPNTGANRRIPLTVRDVSDSIIVSPTLRWRSADTNLVTIDSLTGVLRVKTVNVGAGGVTITVRSDTVTRAQTLRVQQVVASLAPTAGDAQTDTVAQIPPAALTITARDSGNTVVAGDSIVFRIGSGSGVLSDSVKVTDAGGQATLGSWTLGTAAGTQTVIATSRSSSATVTFSATAIAGVPKKLGYTVQPTTAAINAAITPSIKLAVQDSLGNTVPNATDNITLTLANNPGGATLGGTLTRAAVSGIATFDNITLNQSGSNYTIQANSGALTSAVSNGFDAFGTATKLAFISQPIGTSAGATMQAIRVAVQDAQGAVVATSTAAITLQILSGPTTTFANGQTTMATNAVAGVATFSTVVLGTAGTYQLRATAGGFTQAVSSTVTIAAVGAPATLAFSVQPSNVVAGASINPAIKVQVLDVNGARVTTSSQQITLSIETNPGSATLIGTTSVNASGGEATFSNVSLTRAGTGYRFLATATGTTLATATSTAFNVSFGTATKLGFIQNPTHAVVGSQISPTVTVAVQDVNGNTVTNVALTAVSLALANCSGPSLTGGGATNTSAGVATFATLSVNAQASNCVLTATAQGLTAVASSPFNVVSASGALRVAFSVEPASATTAGVAMAAGTVGFQAGSGSFTNVSSLTPITLSVLSGPGSISSGQTTQTTTSSTSFSLAFNTAGTYRLLASAPGYDPDTSAAFTISAAAANKVAVVTDPDNIVAGVPFATTIQATVQDQFGNTVTGSSNTITITAQTSSPVTVLRLNNGQLSISAPAVDGVATFPGLSVRAAASGARFIATSPGLNTTVSSFLFSVFAAPASRMTFKTQPQAATVAGATMNNIEVQVEDSVGNVITDYGNPITVSLTGGNASAVLNGTKIKTPTAGVAQFGDLSVTLAGAGYILQSTASGLTPGASSSFNITTSSNSWVSGFSPLPAARRGAAAAAIGNVVYVAGGTEGGDQASLYGFTASSGTWSPLASMPGGRYEGNGAASIDGELYVAGGWTTGSGLPQNNLFIYNPGLNQWREGPAMPTASGCGASGVIANKLYVYTACNGVAGYRKFLHAFDRGAGSWSSALASPTFAHAYPAFGVINGKLYVAGGFDETGNSVTKLVEVYDPVANSWAPLPDMGTARAAAASAVINGKLYVFGGQSAPGNPNLATGEVYDPVANSWTPITVNPTGARGFMASTAFGSFMIVVGGTNNGGANLTTFEAYSP